MYRNIVKPTFDRASGFILLLLLAPVLGIVALGVRVFIGSPVLFRHRRPGLHGRVFTLLKFRTMTAERDHQGQVLPDEFRLAGFGKGLRASSLDELPSLLNVLKGDMSLVGPRPLLCEYLERYSHEQARRHDVKPGITGWAQVNGRNALSWPQKFSLDVWYVDHLSARLDLFILCRTVWQVICRRGINHPDAATAPEFLASGNEQ